MEKSMDFGFVFKNNETKHKIKPSQFTSVAGGVQKRRETKQKYRKSCRLTEFDNVRDISIVQSPKPVQPVNEAQLKIEQRRQQLEKWKEEKEMKKKQQAMQKKKPFVAGVVHAPLKFIPPPPPKALPSTSGRVTRSQTRNQVQKQKEVKPQAPMQSFAPKNAKFKPPPIKNPIILPVLGKKTKTKVSAVTFEPVAPRRRSARKSASTHNFIVETIIPSLETTSSTSVESTDSAILPTKKKTPRKSLPQEKNNNTPKNKRIPKSESSSEEKLRSPKDVPKTPEQIEEFKTISPTVTMSRGKENARKEMMKKLKEGLLDEDSCDMGSVTYFRRQMESEVQRMTLMCAEWDQVYDETELPEFVQEKVLGAVGQARLLMSSKMRQFAGLVARCENRDASAGLITPADLAGFWDMIFIQISDIDIRFKQLEQLRVRNWAEEAPKVVLKKAPKAKKVKPKASGNSRIKEMIAAARKAKKVQESSEDTSSSSSPAKEEKTFEAGFFSVRSPVRSPIPSPAAVTPHNKPSLLRSVISNEARKASATKNSPASFAMLRASLIGKNVDIDGVTPLEQTPKQINLDATPARSILKSAQKKKKSPKKSIKTVLFEKSNSITPQKDFEPLQMTPNKENIDSGLSSDSENKENRRRSVLTRQNATESPIMTRARRKSLQTPIDESKFERKVLQEENQTPKRSSRRSNKSLEPKVDDLIDFNSPKPQPRRRGRKAAA